MLKRLTFLAAGIFLSLQAHAGAISGGGGKGVVCRAADGTIRSASTLDLYEGATVYGALIAESSEPYEKQVQQALEKFPGTTRGFIRLYTINVMKNMRIIHGTVLTDVPDALVIAVPSGCAVEQLANYFTDQNILINGDIWDRLSETGKASLIMHESVYASERMYGAKDSMRTRHVVASLFDPSTVWSDPNEGIPKDALTCFSNGTTFKAFQKNDGTWQLSFNVLAGQGVFSKKEVNVDDFSHVGFDLNEAKNFTIEKGDDKIGTGSAWTVQARSDFEDRDDIMLGKNWVALVDTKGNVIPGFQRPIYKIGWVSANYPDRKVDLTELSCMGADPSPIHVGQQ